MRKVFTDRCTPWCRGVASIVLAFGVVGAYVFGSWSVTTWTSHTALGAMVTTNLVVIVVYAYWRIHRRFFSQHAYTEVLPSLPPRISTFGVLIALTCSVFVFAQVTAMYVYSLIGDHAFDTSMTQRTEAPMALIVFLTVVCAPLAEEIIFRGVVLQLFQRVGSSWCAIIVSTAIFAVVHGNLTQMIVASVVGLTCACVYTFTGRLTLCIAIHAIFNALTLCIPPAWLSVCVHPFGVFLSACACVGVCVYAYRVMFQTSVSDRTTSAHVLDTSATV